MILEIFGDNVLTGADYLTGANAHFVPPFGVFFWLIPFLRDRQSHPSVLIHSSNQCLLATAIRPSSKPA
jgi:hypothetical protein